MNAVTPEPLPETIRRWLLSTAGQRLLLQENRCLETLLSDVFGYYLVQMGWTWAFQNRIAGCRIPHPVFLEPQFPGMGGSRTIISAASCLPIATDSVDAVFLPHTLDFIQNPYEILCEVERILIPEGRVIIFGFNSWSTWDVWRLFSAQPLPWSHRLPGNSRVIHWLTELGFRVEQQPPILWWPPHTSEQIWRSLRHFEPLTHSSRHVSAIYALRAVKRVSTPTALGRIWRLRVRLFTGNIIEPTTGKTANV